MKRFILFVSVILLLSSHDVYPQVNNDWQWYQPKPQGNDIRFLKMISPSNWVAVGYTGTMMRTTNAGANWLVYTNYFGYYTAFLGQGKNIYGADFNGNTGVAVGTQGWIARTTNGGVSWDSIGSSAGTIALWNASFGDANTVYAGGNSGIVLKSTNGGLSWTSLPSPSGNANRTIFALDANTVFAGSLNGIVYKSTNGGSSWNTLSTGGSTIIFGIYFFNANTGIATGGTGLVRTTTNGGTTWNIPSVFPTASETRVFARKNPDEIYLLGDASILYRSTDYGSTWTSIMFQYPGQVVSLVSNTMDISGSTWAVGGVNGLLNASTNSGANWSAQSLVYTDYNIFDIGFVPNSPKVWTVGNTAAGRNNSILYSTNRGVTWTVQSSLPGAYLRVIDMIDENTGWISGNNGLVLKTTNGGAIWTTVVIPGASTQSLTYVQFVNASTGWVFGYSAGPNLFKTTDGGNTWQTQTFGSTDNGARWATMLNANTGYYISYNITNSRLFKTTNGGDNWTEQSYPSPRNLWSMKMVSVDSGYICGDGGYLARTVNGSTWTQVSTPTNHNYTATDWKDFNNGVLGAGSGFVGRTTDKGQSWTLGNTGGSSVWSVRMQHPDTVWVSQGFGFLHKFMRGITGVIEWKNDLPQSFVLKQNYPNPFNPVTKIEFALPKSGNVSLKVYDISGRLVSTLIDNLYLNPGKVSVTFDGSNFSSGVYFYRIDALGKTETKKMILVK